MFTDGVVYIYNNMETRCACGKLESELKPGHKGSCVEYKKQLKNIEDSITYDYLYNEYIINGKSLKYIAKELKLAKTRIIEKKLKEFNINKRTLQEAKKQKHHIELAKNTSLDRYGVEFHLQKNSALREKSIITNQQKYGVDFACQSSEVKEKIKQTNLEKYNAVNVLSKNTTIRAKMQSDFLLKYGVDNPWKLKDIQNKCLKTKLNNNKNNTYYSKESQVIFWNIYNKLPQELKKYTYFAELNKEYGKYDKINNKYYFYDFIISYNNIKYCIEYNGNYYHANPTMYSENFYNKHLKLHAKDIWNKDKLKNNFISNLGYELYIIWENDDIDTICNNILTNIHNNINY